jgi:hypothetical protein
MKTGDQISPPGGYVGGGLQMQTDLAIDPAGNVWVMNNWQDIEVASARLPRRFRPAAVAKASLAQACPRTADRASTRALRKAVQGVTTGHHHSSATADVRFGSLADITADSRYAWFTPESRHVQGPNRCPLSAKSGHLTKLNSPFPGCCSCRRAPPGLGPIDAHRRR